jgi:hypothetical protein
MRVNVTDCWCGADKFKWRLEFNVDGRPVREAIYHDASEPWDRKAAANAKDVISSVYGVTRSSIRFDVV